MTQITANREAYMRKFSIVEGMDPDGAPNQIPTLSAIAVSQLGDSRPAAANPTFL